MFFCKRSACFVFFNPSKKLCVAFILNIGIIVSTGRIPGCLIHLQCQIRVKHAKWNEQIKQKTTPGSYRRNCRPSYLFSGCWTYWCSRLWRSRWLQFFLVCDKDTFYIYFFFYIYSGFPNSVWSFCWEAGWGAVIIYFSHHLLWPATSLHHLLSFILLAFCPPPATTPPPKSIYFSLIYQFIALKSSEPISFFPTFGSLCLPSVPSVAFISLSVPLFHHPSAVSLSGF